MKLITLHRRYTSINYKNSLCSFATLFVISVTIFAIIAPFYIAFSLFHDLWSQYKLVYEQPDVRFDYKYIFTAEFTKASVGEVEMPAIDTKVAVCSSYKYLNKALNDPMECSMIKVSAQSTSAHTLSPLIDSIFSTGKRIRISTTKPTKWPFNWQSIRLLVTTWAIWTCS